MLLPLMLLLSIRGAAGFGSLQSRAAALHAAWAQHAPALPDRRLSTLAASDWREMCGAWWGEYARMHRQRTPCTWLGVGGCHVFGPTTGSHGVGDWQMELLGTLFRHPSLALVIAWPELMGHSMGGAGAINATAPLRWEDLPQAAEAAVAASGGGGDAAAAAAAAVRGAGSPGEPPPRSALRGACALELLLRPSEALLETIREPMATLLDADALTIGIHVRTGAADVRGDCGGDLEECGDARAMSEADELPLVRQAMRCAASLERRWLGTRARSVWLVVSDSVAVHDLLARELAAAADDDDDDDDEGDGDDPPVVPAAWPPPLGPPSWPSAVVVDVPGYTGPVWMPSRPTWVPIPVNDAYDTEEKQGAKGLPLKPCWAVSIHKSQGMSFLVLRRRQARRAHADGHRSVD